jgi:ribosome-interacting GTPase 1
MIREDINDEQLDVILGNRHYVLTFAVLNKMDMIDRESLPRSGEPRLLRAPNLRGYRHEHR